MKNHFSISVYLLLVLLIPIVGCSQEEQNIEFSDESGLLFIYGGKYYFAPIPIDTRISLDSNIFVLKQLESYPILGFDDNSILELLSNSKEFSINKDLNINDKWKKVYVSAISLKSENYNEFDSREKKTESLYFDSLKIELIINYSQSQKYKGLNIIKLRGYSIDENSRLILN